MCSRLVRANCKLGRRSISVMECLSRSLAIEGLFEITPVIANFYKDAPIEIMFITDSMCNAMVMALSIPTSSNIISSNCSLQRGLVKRLAQIFHRSTIKLFWATSKHNAADNWTRISQDPIALINSPKYRNGKGYIEHAPEIFRHNAYITQSPNDNSKIE